MDEPPDPLPDVFAVVFEERDPGLQFKYDLGKKCCVVSGFSRSGLCPTVADLGLVRLPTACRNDKGQPMEAEWRGSIPLGSSILSVAAKPTDDCTEEQVCF